MYKRQENLRIFATLRGVPNNHAIKDALDLVGLPYKDKKLFSQYSLSLIHIFASVNTEPFGVCLYELHTSCHIFNGARIPRVVDVYKRQAL